jgi:DNA repair exonuclease SbcCD ATPase subunit
MAKTRSDLEIATGKAELKDIAKMLENYSVEEITAMQNSSLRKIREEYGKKGEILRAKIEGLELAKADIDTAELELQKNALNEQIEDVKAKQDDLSKQLEEIDKESNGIVKLKCELNELVRQANENLVNQKSELRSKICDLEAKIRTYSSEIYKCQSDIDFYTDLIKKSETNRQSLAEQWKSVKAEEFDKETTICPTCHRELPQEDVERLLSEFETTKAERLDKIKESGLKAKETIEEAKTKLDELNNRLSLCVKQNDGIELELKSLNKELSELPGSVDISNREDVVALNEQIKAKEQAVNSYNDNSGKKVEFANKLFELQNQLTEVNKQIALANRNVEIDENITELRSKQREYEQNKADCEKILSQLDLLSRLKNELAADDINSHYFKIVKWKLYDYQKNGEYKSTCIPLIDGYEFGTATNKGREVLAKLDIISGLQNFYGVDYPVFIDNAECLSNDTISRIDMDCQLIMLKVSEDKEITVMEV